MSQIDRYLAIGDLAMSVGVITGKASDGAAAAGYGAWVESITGSLPTVLTLPERRAKVVLSQAQALSMQQWIDRQIASSVRAKDPPSLQVEFGPVVKPLLIKYAVVYGALAFILGAIVSRALK